MGGELPKLIVAHTIETELGHSTEAEDIFRKIFDFIDFCIDIFGKDDFYIECAPSSVEDQIMVNQKLIEIASYRGLNMIPATDSHYLSKETRFAHKAYLNSKGGDREVDSFYEFARLMDEKEVRELLALSFEANAIDAIMNMAEEMRQKIKWYSLEKPQQIPMVDVKFYEIDDGYWLSEYPTLSKLISSSDIQERYWVNECLLGLQEKGLYNNEYLARLEIEADVIKFIGDRLGTCLYAYFNTFKHYIDLFWDCGSIVGPGRGSATGFLSNYLLGITQLDPLKWNLPWWRFLNKERAELPSLLLILGSIKRMNPAKGCARKRANGEA